MTVIYSFYIEKEKIHESSIPLFRLTKSKNGKTGTAVFYFLNPICFKKVIEPIDLFLIESSLGILSTRLIHVIFFQGKPRILKVIFLFRNSQEWKNFLDIFSI
jgi:photosystem II reaction center protein Psb28